MIENLEKILAVLKPESEGYDALKKVIEEKKPVTCPLCDSDKICLTDYEPLYVNKSKNPQGLEMLLDDELYASAVCFSCNAKLKLIGNIKYRIRK